MTKKDQIVQNIDLRYISAHSHAGQRIVIFPYLSLELKQRTLGWSDDIFSHCKLRDNHDQAFQFTVQVNEDNLPPEVKGLEGEDFLLGVARLLHSSKDPCDISVDFAQDISGQARNMLYVAQVLIYEPEEKTEEGLCGLLKTAAPGWTDDIFSRCKLAEVSDDLVRFNVQMDESRLPPTIKGLEGEELLLKVAQLLHGDHNACRISTGFAEGTPQETQTDMLVSTAESEDICPKCLSPQGHNTSDKSVNSVIVSDRRIGSNLEVPGHNRLGTNVQSIGVF
ncbi:hypothetical protein T265_07695 [Opisthorchis viverrini]|uniref:Uncharacterized protein n=1 Tax=Opisthorchis viverrini TaxID=6198 RepID=A0A074ZGC1_OPIVI|nr:hypothetical protein T265_07695 [Opisthorchis viverrini]KER24692.1 hypothetical protein T265_07695 [Opisthorchis viverrini]